MSNQNEPKSRDDIQKAFTPLLRSYQATASQIATKAEEAEAAKDRETVERVAVYTVESIVNDLAKLQLEFGSSVEAIAEQLEDESSKLNDLKRAIQVESRRLDRLQHTILAAEALAILEQDHQQKLAAFEEKATQERSELDSEIDDKRAEWQAEAKEHQASFEEYQANQTKERAQAAEDHDYERERQRKLEADANAEQRRNLERELAEQEAAKAKHWAAREKALAEAADKIEALRSEVAGFPEKLEGAVKQAREKAIASVNREAKFEAEMEAKEHDANVKVFELEIQTLEQRISDQAKLIAELNAKLDTTIAKSQSLAEQAFRQPRGE